MAIEVSSLSRFAQTDPIVLDNGVETFGFWRRPDFLKEENLREEQIETVFIDSTLAGRPDEISRLKYGTPFLEWVVVMFNRPKDTLGFPKIGTVIKIPERSIVLSNT